MATIARHLTQNRSGTAQLRLPIAHRRVIRTTNLLERLFGEERSRTKVIPHAFGERAG